MKVLLLGKDGLLGSEFPRLLEAHGIAYQAPSRRELDITDFTAVDRFLAHEYFDRILYCAGYTDVEKAEIEQGLCEMVNVKALENIVSHKRPIITFSTDYVFDAPENLEIFETYPRGPLNFYGQTKAKAEEILEQSGVDFWNIRTSWIFGKGKENFITHILRKALESETLEVVDDQIGRPTYAKDLADFVVKHFLLQSPDPGHYHFQNTGASVSWAEVAQYCLEQKDLSHVRLKRIGSDHLGLRAKRPKNSVLKNTRLSDDLRDWKQALEEYLLES